MDEHRKLSGLQQVAEAQRLQKLSARAALIAAVQHESSRRERAKLAQTRVDEMLSYWMASMEARALDPHLIASLADALTQSEEKLAHAQHELDRAAAEVVTCGHDHARSDVRERQTLRAVRKLTRRRAHRSEEHDAAEIELRTTRAWMQL